MIFNDYVVALNKQYEQLQKTQYVVDKLKQVIINETNWINSIIGTLTSNNITNSSYQNASIVFDKSTNFCINLKKDLISIDFFEFTEALATLEKCGINDVDENFFLLKDSFKSCYKIIHSFIQNNNINEITKNYYSCINAIKEIVELYDQFIHTHNYINKISNGLCKHIQGETLEIQLLNNEFTKDSYNKVVDPVYKIYEQLCLITNVKEDLSIVRLESGSLFTIFVGSIPLIKAITCIIEKAYDIFLKRFTPDGQKENLVESSALLEKQVNIIKMMKDMGLDVKEDEEIIRSCFTRIIKQTNILLAASPDIRINDKLLQKSKDITNLLEQQNFKLIEKSNDKENNK